MSRDKGKASGLLHKWLLVCACQAYKAAVIGHNSSQHGRASSPILEEATNSTACMHANVHAVLKTQYMSYTSRDTG